MSQIIPSFYFLLHFKRFIQIYQSFFLDEIFTLRLAISWKTFLFPSYRLVSVACNLIYVSGSHYKQSATRWALNPWSTKRLCYCSEIGSSLVAPNNFYFLAYHFPRWYEYIFLWRWVFKSQIFSSVNSVPVVLCILLVFVTVNISKYITAGMCVFISFHRKGFSWLNETINLQLNSAMVCWGIISLSRIFVSAS